MSIGLIAGYSSLCFSVRCSSFIFVLGSATTIISNPVWVIQTSQAVHTMSAGSPESKSAVRKLGFFETIRKILTKDGIGYVCFNVRIISCTAHHVNSAFWRGVGPALVLVINPVLQYTVFEQLKNALVSRRTSRLHAAGAAATAVAVLTDWDFFLLGAVSKLGTLMLCNGKTIDSDCRFQSCNGCHISLHVRGPRVHKKV